MPNPIFEIHLSNLHWITEDHPETDLCAHGSLYVQIGNEVVLDEEANSSWTVSATALLLLRTLELNHTKDCPIGDQLVPCCGHTLYLDENTEEVYILGCATGYNWDVRHSTDKIILRTAKGLPLVIPFTVYKEKVLAFVSQVEQFYNVSLPKELPTNNDDRKAYLKFWEEWHRRRSKWE
ncbi:hypothetical protein [Nibribacter koreensis]|uniref:Uncharacterized protein n=1 Tax=Nibribacter koreensis TaxID=1084519 RepID=A0ABP8FCZ0_9BACT